MDAPQKTAPRLFLIDGYALIYRSYFAFIQRPLTNSRGDNTSAAWGVANFLVKIREDFQPDYLAVVFDAGRSAREAEYPEYKATREKMPDELHASIPEVRDLIEAYGCPVLEVEGFEADDVIGTLARLGVDAGLDVVVVSGDKDFYQLIGPHIHLLNPGRGGPGGVAAEWVDESNASDKFGVRPDQVVDYLALVGDSSDNVPGAPGIGPKTALQLLQRWGTLEALFEHVEELEPKRARTSLGENTDAVRLSRRLVTIRADAPIDLDLERLRETEPDWERLRALLVEYEFRTLLEKLPAAASAASATVTRTLQVHVPHAEEIGALVGAIEAAGRVELQTWSTREKPVEGRLVGMALLAPEEERVWYLPLGHRPSGGLSLGLGGEEEPQNLPGLETPQLAALKRVLESPAVHKGAHDAKDALVALSTEGVTLRGLSFDAMVASYVLDPSRRSHDLDALAQDLLGEALPTRKSLVGSGKSEVPFEELAVERVAAFACARTGASEALHERLAEGLESQEMDRLFEELEMPLVPILAEMETIGIRIDEGFFRDMSVRLARELKLIQDELFKIAGEEFNLNSTPQLREILFERLELPVIKRTKTGPSTDSDVLEELAAQGHAFPVQLLEYRQLEKLRSTYVDAFPKLINPRTGRLHTRFNQAVAATGRLSSSEPNLQNIPIRTSLGREIRRGFVADPGHVLLAVDYSQIELRILAHFSGDEAFVSAFRERVDVHRQTASVIFGVPVADVTPEMRAQAKTINFATLYGQGDFSLARQLGIPRAEARAFIDAYFERFSGVRAYLDRQIEFAKKHGYVETLAGRRRYVPELQSRNWSIRQFGERVAQNTPIQGTAADLIKQAMIDVHERMQEAGNGARMLLQVHDELLLEVPEGALEETRSQVVEAMEGAMQLDVPLVAEAGVGPTWYDCKGG